MKPKSPKKHTSRDLAKIIAQAAHDTKSQDIAVLDLRKLEAFSDFFVIASGTSDRQVQAICDRIEERMKASGHRHLNIEGYETGHWVLIDFGSVVAHIFYEETRTHYALEKLWGDAPRVRFRLT